MSLWKIAWRSIQRRGLASSLTALSMALGVFLIVAVLLVLGIVTESFENNSSLGYNMIIGAEKGGGLQIVMNTVFYLSNPVENIDYSYYQNFLSAADQWRYFRSFSSPVEMRRYFDVEDRWLMFKEFVNAKRASRFFPPDVTEQFFVACIGADEARGRDSGQLEELCLDRRWKFIREFVDAREIVELVASEAGKTKWSARERQRLLAMLLNDEELRKFADESHVESGDAIEQIVVSPNQLADLFHDQTGNGRFSEYASLAIPVCLGDYFENYRVVGTTPAFFERIEYRADRGTYRLSQGRNFKTYDTNHRYFESVIGAAVAREKGLTVGDTINPTHGSAEGEKHDAFHIVGILETSGTPNDRAVFVNMEGFMLLKGHAKYEVNDPPDASGHREQIPLLIPQREVTAVLLRTTNPLVARYLHNAINEGSNEPAQAVLPVAEIHQLFSKIVAPFKALLLLITAMICLVSGVSILVSIYNSMNDRHREIAVMRALGAGRRTVMLVILLESIILSTAGGFLGWLSGHVLIGGVANPVIVDWTGVDVGVFDLAPPPKWVNDWIQAKNTGFDGTGFHAIIPVITRVVLSSEMLLIPALLVLAVLVGFLPALAAYRTDVARALNANP